MRAAFLVAAAALFFAGAGAWAQTSPSVASARAAGFVGERYDGYLGARTAIPPAVRRATEDVNLRRRALYSSLASRRGVSPQEVGITAGCTLLERVAVGEWYVLGDGEWRQRKAGQRPPVPDYCTAG